MVSQNWIQLRHTTTTSALPYSRLHYTIPHYTTQNYKTLRCTTLHYTTLLALHHGYSCNCTCNYTNYTTLRLRLHYTTLQLQRQLQLQLQLHYTTLHPAVVVRWPLQPLQPLQKTQLQPPVGPSVDSLCHPWFAATNLSYRFPIFETSATASTGKSRGISSLCFKQLLFSAFSLVLWAGNMFQLNATSQSLNFGAPTTIFANIIAF